MDEGASTKVIRRFNRTYTQRVGALEESFLGTGRSLGASRLLFELGGDGATVRDLRARLDLDSGYVSRLLARLELEGLVSVTADPDDRRRRLVRLTRRGTAARRKLDDRSEALAEGLLEPLSPRQRGRLVDALKTADLLVRAATVAIHEVAPTDPWARESVARYVSELDARFPTGFVPDAPTADDAASLTTPRGAFVVAMSDGAPVACGGVRRLDEETLEIKRMWVDDQWRGAGLGTRVLRRLEREAERLGGSRVVLDTNRTLVEAMAMYERAGYRETPAYHVGNPYAQAWYEKSLPRR